MCWPGNWSFPYEAFDYRKDSERFWGDQEFLWDLLGDDWVKIPHVGSYKYHIRPNQEIPEWMRICAFHGKPDPHEVKDKCLSAYTSALHSLISANMPSG